MGKIAAERRIDLIEHPETAIRKPAVYPVELVEGGTVAQIPTAPHLSGGAGGGKNGRRNLHRLQPLNSPLRWRRTPFFNFAARCRRIWHPEGETVRKPLTSSEG